MIDNETLCTAAFAISSGAVGVAILALRRKVSVATGLGDWRAHESDRQRIAQLEQMLAGERQDNARLSAERSRHMFRINELESELNRVERDGEDDYAPTAELISRHGENNQLRARVAELEKEVIKALDYIPEWAQQKMERADKGAQRIAQLESLLELERNGERPETWTQRHGAPNAAFRDRCIAVAKRYQDAYSKPERSHLTGALLVSDMRRAAADMAGVIVRDLEALS